MRPTAIALFAAWALSAGLSAPVLAAAKFDVLVCYPGGGTVTDRQARPAMQKMLGVIESLGGWPAGTFQHSFTAKVGECRKLLAKSKPAITLTSLGLFLEHRAGHHLVPISKPRMAGSSEEIYRVMTKKGGPASLAALKGKTLGGSLLDESEFLQRIVFAGQIDPASHFQLKPAKRALRDLRKLAKGELDAVLVNDQQFRALGSLGFAKELQPIFASKPLPLIGLAADSQQVDAADRQRLTEALSKMCTHETGREVCEMFGLQSFAPANPADYQGVISLWNAK